MKQGDGETAPGSAGPGKRPRSKAKLALFVAIPALSSVLVLEGVLRLAGMPSGVVSSLGHCWADARSNALGPFQPSFRATIAFPKELTYHPGFNSLGLRGPELPLARTPGVARVLCAGDSTTFGFYVEDQDTYPFRLETRLAASGKKVEVANGGCGSWTITDEARFLEDHALALEPDVVVLLFCGNDLPELDRPSRYEEQERYRHEGDPPLRRLLHATAIYEAHLRLRLALAQTRGAVDLTAPQEAQDDAHWQRYAHELTALAAKISEKGAKLVVASFPGVREVRSGSCDTERRLPGIVASLGAERAAYVDLYPAFRAHEKEGLYNLPLDEHTNARGNDVMAETIARALIEKGWLVERSGSRR